MKHELSGGRLDAAARGKLWEIELGALEKVKAICEKHGLSWFLLAGCALGAVRHGGFIPWDDDMDIGMLRPDFETFVRVAQNELGDDYALEYGTKNGGFYPFCRIRHRNSTAFVRDYFDKPGVHGVFLEIYVFDRVPESPFLRGLQRSLSRKLLRLMKLRVYGPETGEKEKLSVRLTRPVPVSALFRLWVKVCRIFEPFRTKRADTVFLPYYSAKELFYYYYEDLERTEAVPFENTEGRLPVGNHRCLTLSYGDYMTPPPPEARERHHAGEVFYDPYRPYTEYLTENFAAVRRYFEENPPR